MTSRLLLVEPSTTMRFVLDNYVQSLGHSVVSVGDYHEAVDALRNQFQSFDDDDFDAIILGWPSIAVREADTLTALLEQDDFHALSVVVMSTDQRAETRAWVADRPNSAMLAWKSYESIDEVLRGLLGANQANASSPTALATPEASAVKFDNQDIGVLLVDDSPSIRESLKNVLTLHGYRIQTVANRDEALAAIDDTDIDIAIVDFYLQDETGDEVCREIIQEDPSIVCAILTSAYSDPIIKLSLKAGAVDCFFKNEAGELLLARIDAIARVVRQRKSLSVQQSRLDKMINAVDAAILVIDTSNKITFVSDKAGSELGFSDKRELLHRSAFELFDAEKLGELSDGKHSGQWVNAEQETVNIDYIIASLNDANEKMLTFETRALQVAAEVKPDTQTSTSFEAEAEAEAGAGAGVGTGDRAGAGVGSETETETETETRTASVTAAAIIKASETAANLDSALPTTVNASLTAQSEAAVPAAVVPPTTPAIDGAADPFLQQLIQYLGQSSDSHPTQRALGSSVPADAADLVSLLILGVNFQTTDGTVIPVSQNAQLHDAAHSSVMAIYRRENHVAKLAAHRYGFLVRHTDGPQSFLLTRKIMQMVNETELPEVFHGRGKLCVNGCLLGLANRQGQPAHNVLSQALSGLRAVDVRGINQALLLDLKRMLPVYPD